MRSLRTRVAQLEAHGRPAAGDGPRCPECSAAVMALTVSTYPQDAADGSEAAPGQLLADVRRCTRCDWSNSKNATTQATDERKKR
jgi:hypothetical protein